MSHPYDNLLVLVVVAGPLGFAEVVEVDHIEEAFAIVHGKRHPPGTVIIVQLVTEPSPSRRQLIMRVLGRYKTDKNGKTLPDRTK